MTSDDFIKEPDITGLLDELVMRTNLGRGFFENMLRMAHEHGQADRELELLREETEE